MKQMILGLALILGAGAQAELKMAQKQIPLYLANDGTQLNPVEAVKRSIKGEKVLKCELVEAQASETGNVSLKKAK